MNVPPRLPENFRTAERLVHVDGETFATVRGNTLCGKVCPLRISEETDLTAGTSLARLKCEEERHLIGMNVVSTTCGSGGSKGNCNEN